MKKILFPTDLSPLSKEGLEYAASLARARRGKLIILYVEELPLAYDYGVPKPETEHLERELNALSPAKADLEIEHRFMPARLGEVAVSPADAIVEFARSEGADLIVMGTHGRSGLSRLLMGSVAEEVLRKAPCPVLTFRSKTALQP
jgi:nucleotide-binding universal stress UspA family protein